MGSLLIPKDLRDELSMTVTLSTSKTICNTEEWCPNEARFQVAGIVCCSNHLTAQVKKSVHDAGGNPHKVSVGVLETP